MGIFDSEEKTEAPTPRKREESRNNGQVARSQDLSAAVLLFVSFLSLNWFGPALWRSLVMILRSALTSEDPANVSHLLPLITAIARESFTRMAPILLVLLAAILVVLYAQVGWLLTGKPLIPSLSKVSPLAGLKRLMSVRSLMTGVINFGKLLIVVAVAVYFFMHNMPAIMFAYTSEFYAAFQLGASLAFSLAMQMSAAMLLLALLDFAWQRFRHEQDLKMTKEEVKDEMRSMEGDPKLKERRRRVQMQLSLQRLQKDVPQADVIVTNPTHFAVAIAYDAQRMPSPKVVAKGADYVALRIRQIATEMGIPIVERKPLARALYDTVEPGEYIPERFYLAIAEILAFVYELTGDGPRKSRAGKSTKKPAMAAV